MTELYLREDPFTSYSPEALQPRLEEALGLYRLLEPQGKLTPRGEEEIGLFDNSLLLRIFDLMVTARILDAWLLKLQRLGRIALYAPSKGQEAAMGASTLSLHPEDWIVTMYRDLPAYLAKGVPIGVILDRFMANADDPYRGKEIIVLGSRRHRVLPAAITVGSSAPLAAGFALASRIGGDRFATVAFMGDGATSRGEFHWSMNFASVLRAPAVFTVVNNQYAISVPIHKQTRSRTIAVKALAYGARGLRVDGNDPLAAYRALRMARDHAVGEREPVLVEMVTYRAGSHTTSDDPSRYRPRQEEEYFQRYDPILRLQKYIVGQGLFTEREVESYWEEKNREIQDIVEKHIEKPPLPPETIFEHVYHRPTWILEEEMQEFRKYMMFKQRLQKQGE